MNCTTIISISELIGTSIHTREASAILMNRIEKDLCDYIELDFSNVEYISRSFSDQFYFDKSSCTKKMNKILVISNANEIVSDMLNAVAKTQNKKLDTSFNIPVFKYSSQSQLENFLLSI